MAILSYTIQCQACGSTLEGVAKHRKFCGGTCSARYYRAHPRERVSERSCRQCGTGFKVITRHDANRQYCSNACSKRGHMKSQQRYWERNPEEWRLYNARALEKNPERWRDKLCREREASLDLLGKRCVVCGVDNPWWLHIDYIPTTRGKPFRHPRGPAFIRRNLADFRLLCANHHYELTLTGRIQGTTITQYIGD